MSKLHGSFFSNAWEGYMQTRWTSFLALALILLLVPGASPSRATGWDEHKTLLDLLKEVSKAKSDPTRCGDWQTTAENAAQALSDIACSTGYSVNNIHGSLIAIRGALMVGNAMLHRHGCKDEAEATMLKARTILISVAGSCIAAGKEADAAKVGLQEGITALGGMSAGVPAALADLYPPAPGGAPIANHCADESPNETSTVNSAKDWLTTYGGISPRVGTNGGSLSCDPSDAQYIWRAYIPTKTPPNIAGPVELVYCNINDGTFSQ